MKVKNSVSSITLANRIQSAIASAIQTGDQVSSALVIVIDKDTEQVIEARLVTEDEMMCLALQYKDHIKN